MFRVTGPVTSSASACRGDATSRAPYRSASYTGPKAAPISISQPLQDPASTCRNCTDPRSAATGGSAVPGSRGGAGSATRPVRRILLSRPIRVPSRGGLVGLAELVEQLGQDPPRGPHQLRDVTAGERVDDGRTLAAGGDDARPPEHRELLGQAGRLDLDLGEQVPDRHRPVLQEFQHPDPDRVAEHPEELGLGLVERNGHYDRSCSSSRSMPCWPATRRRLSSSPERMSAAYSSPVSRASRRA